MNSWLRVASGTLAATLLVTASAGAQESCELQTTAPNEMRTAMDNLGRYQLGAGTPQQRHDYLKNAVRAATERPERFRTNEVGRQYALAQALTFYVADDNMPLVQRRADVGFASDRESTIDIVAALDQALNYLERERPGCAQEFEGMRALAWQRLLQVGVNHAHGGNADSAVVLIRRANTFYDGLPHGHYYLAAVLQQAGRTDEAVRAFRETVDRISPDAALEDTTLADFRDASLYVVGLAEYERAESLSGAEQRQAMAEAARLFKMHIEEFPESERTGNTRILLITSLAQSGDTTALQRARQDMVANADQFTALQLLEAGTHAFNTKDTELAKALLEKGIERNPYHRAGLFNLANVYWDARQFDRMLNVSRRLVEIDPNNPYNYDLLALAMEGNAPSIQNAQARRAQIDSAAAMSARARSLPVEVTIGNITADGSGRAVAGSVKNTTNAQRSVNLQIEFLDEGGQVVGREATQVQVPANGQQTFRVSVPSENAVAYRYSRIS
jgi:tetratricopeptide (TPR) repeat protein